MKVVEPIQKIFTGKHVDLSKLVSISDAYFIDRMGSGGYYAGFHMHFQLMDEPIRYTRPFEHDEANYRTGTRRSPIPVRLDKEEIEDYHYVRGNHDHELLAVHRLQKQVNELIQQWKEVREYYA